MDDPVVLDDDNPSVDTVRRWAYDESLYLIEEDEDLILHGPHYTPLLLQLAREPACPKRDYCMSIVYYGSQLLLLAREQLPCRRILDCIDNDVSTSSISQEWARRFRDGYDRLIAPRRMTLPEAESLARWLLVGEYCRRSFCATGSVVDGFREFKCFSESYDGFVYINLDTGIWRQSRHVPLKSIDRQR